MGSQLCHPPHTAEGTSQTHSLRNPLQGVMKCKCSRDADPTQTAQHRHKNIHVEGNDDKTCRALIHTFLRHIGIPGIVSLLRCLIAHCVAALGPPQDTERPVQPPEGPAPH